MNAPEAAAQDPALLALRERHQALKKAQPRLRIRRAARQLGVSEGLLLSLDLGQGVRRLKGDGPFCWAMRPTACLLSWPKAVRPPFRM